MNMVNQKSAEEKLKSYHQEHILGWINMLEDEKKQGLIHQILQIDFDKISKLYEDTKKKKEISCNQITPINAIDKEKMEPNEKREIKKIGENILQNDEYAVVTMAGGQGTRLGFKGPKGTFKLDIGENGKYIFEILTDTLKKAKQLYNSYPYWYIMTSHENNKQTIDFFEKHNYFGYDKNRIKFFKQGTLPMLTKEGKLIVENGKIKTASDGNGGVYAALQKEKMLEDMKSKKIKWVYICGVDNIMVNPIDPIFIGLTIKNKMQIASKSVMKACPEEKVGVFCKRDGKPSIVEYIELSEKMRIECDKNGSLIYGDANIVSHLLTVEAIEKISHKKLESHLAIKNNLYKFETFLFDGFQYLDDMLVMRIKREEEFAPIKNQKGVDSPETAKAIYENSLINKERDKEECKK